MRIPGLSFINMRKFLPVTFRHKTMRTGFGSSQHALYMERVSLYRSFS